MSKNKLAVHVATIKKTCNGKTYVTHLLRHTFREDGKVKHVTVGNLSDLPDDLIEVIRKRLSGGPLPVEGNCQVIRSTDDKGTLKYDYLLSNAPADTPLNEFARVANAEHRVEECIQRGKSEAGLADYQVRNWLGWHHHITLSLMAAWFLVGETRRGKKGDPRPDRSPGPPGVGADHSPSLGVRHSHPNRPRGDPPSPTQRACPILPP